MVFGREWTIGCMCRVWACARVYNDNSNKWGWNVPSQSDVHCWIQLTQNLTNKVGARVGGWWWQAGIFVWLPKYVKPIHQHTNLHKAHTHFTHFHWLIQYLKIQISMTAVANLNIAIFFYFLISNRPKHKDQVKNIPVPYSFEFHFQCMISTSCYHNIYKQHSPSPTPPT